MRSRFFLTDNPGAGYGSRRLVDDVVAEVQQQGARVTRQAVASAEAALAILSAAARSGDYDALLAAGGDGTIRLTAKAALGTTIPIGFIPLGTGNVLAHEVAMPRDPAALAQILLHGPATPINAAYANGELFLLMLGIGFDGRIIASLDQRLKHRLGKLAYLSPTLRALAHGADQLTITLDGGSSRHQASWAIIANARCYGGGFVLAPRAQLKDRDLLAILFHGSRRQRLAQLMSLALGRLELRSLRPGSDLTVHVCRSAHITSASPVPTQIDGDPFEVTPISVESAGPVVSLLLPLTKS